MINEPSELKKSRDIKNDFMAVINENATNPEIKAGDALYISESRIQKFSHCKKIALA
jgi:hypothetical protein